VTDILLLDVTPLSLGIETMGGVFTKIIEKNTTIPTKREQIFTTAADGQTAVDVHVLQGEREFAQYNKTLGRFQLSGIAPAPRGVPQIQVTFDIDANGIVNVSAKDLGTGKEQKVTITASTNLSDDEIKRAMDEAERFADEDRKKKEEVDARNDADSIIYQIEKTMKDMEGKIDAADKSTLEGEIASVRSALNGSDVEAIKSATESLRNKSYEVFGKVYQQQGGDPNAAGAGAGAGYAGAGQAGPNAGGVDADYEVVDDDAPTADGARFCAECGAKLEDGARFCSSCGAKA